MSKQQLFLGPERTRISYFTAFNNKFVISTGAKRSGEICGFCKFSRSLYKGSAICRDLG